MLLYTPVPVILQTFGKMPYFPENQKLQNLGKGLGQDTFYLDYLQYTVKEVKLASVVL